ncbi:MAG: hypothetical protein KTR31_33845 [Myxococcales bacterium]|nr:hypothetical protein [Myxococcales bacterium]
MRGLFLRLCAALIAAFFLAQQAGHWVGVTLGVRPPPPAHTSTSLPPPAPPPPPLTSRIASTVVAAATFTGLVVWLSASARRDLRRLEQVSQNLGQGELDARTGLTTGALGALGRRFDTMADRVQRLVVEHRELLAAVSHELRTPMARLRFELEAARTSERLDLEAFDEELDAMDSLLTELLELHRLEQPPPPDLTEVPFDELRAMVEGARVLAVQRDVILELTGTGSLPMRDRDAAHLVRNLLSNAIRHATSRVQVHLEPGSVTVDDDGRGVRAADRERIFEPFVTGDTSRSRALGGVGLGLALARRAAERWSGTITVADSPLGGARFVVRFPDVVTPTLPVQRPRAPSNDLTPRG